MEAATWQKGKDPISQVAVAPDRKLITNSTKVDNIVTASTPASVPSTPSVSAKAEAPQGGWVIQIGASPDENSARGLLQNAQEKGGAALRSAKPFTVAFSREGSQVYRARFGGFDGQAAAVNACNALKKKGVSLLGVTPVIDVRAGGGLFVETSPVSSNCVMCSEAFQDGS